MHLRSTPLALCALVLGLAPFLRPTLHAQDAPPVAEYEAEAARETYRSLAESAVATSPKAVAAYDAVERAMPDFFSSPTLPGLCVMASQTKKTVEERGLQEKQKEARAELDRLGFLEYLKDKSVRKAVLYLDEARVFARFGELAEESGAAFGKLRGGARNKVCLAYCKLLSGALEMQAMDSGGEVPRNAPVNQDALVAAKLIQEPVSCPDGGPACFSTDDAGQVRCSRHGSPTADAPPAGGLSDDEIEALRERNPFFRGLYDRLKDATR